jgi:hypothetical protein
MSYFLYHNARNKQWKSDKSLKSENYLSPQKQQRDSNQNNAAI